MPSILFTILYFIGLGVVIYWIVIKSSHPSKALAWVMLVTFVPAIGIMLYYLFGKNYRKERMFQRKKLEDWKDFDRLATNIDAKHVERMRENDALNKYERLVRMLMRSAKSLLLRGNDVKFYHHGTTAFKDMFEALRAAKRYIHIEFYIIEYGELADELAEILVEKSQAGVKCRIIYDGVGSWSLNENYIAELREAGVEVYPFMPVRFGQFANKINYRNHRKIVVVDGKVGFTGGLNISDRYTKGDPKLGFWRDTHVGIKGPSVSFLDFIFYTDWNFVSGEERVEPTSPNGLNYQGDTLVQLVASGPDNPHSSIEQAYVYIIANAQKYIYIANSYLIPGERVLFALKAAGLGGVDVRIIVPKVSDHFIVKWSAGSYYEELLESGVRVYEYRKGFIHSKVIMADDQICSVGSANMDIRSFEHNFELNAIIYDEEKTVELKEQFFRDLEDSVEIDLETLRQRPHIEKVKEATARLVSPLL